MIDLDFFEEEILSEPKPIANAPITVFLGKVFVNKVNKNENEYQVFVRESSQAFGDFKIGMEILINGVVKVKATSLPGNDSKVFNINLTPEEAAKVTNKQYDCYFVETLPIFLYKDWQSKQVAKYKRGEAIWQSCVERSQPINVIVASLMAVNEAVRVWSGYTGDPKTIPESDYYGVLLNEEVAKKRYSFWLKSQKALDNIAIEAESMELSSPIGEHEIEEARRTKNLMQIAAIYNTDTYKLEYLSDQSIQKIWTKLHALINEETKKLNPTVAPEKLDESTKKPVQEPSKEPTTTNDLESEKPVKSPKLPKS